MSMAKRKKVGPIKFVRVSPEMFEALRKLAGKSKREVYGPKRHNVAAGFYDEDGQFHPIRASWDYSSSRAGEKHRGGPKSGFKFRANPVRRVRKTTGWLKAKSVRILKQHGRTVVQIKRGGRKR